MHHQKKNVISRSGAGDNDFFSCCFLCVVIRTRRRHRRTRPRAGTQKEMDCTRVYAGVRERACVVCVISELQSAGVRRPPSPLLYLCRVAAEKWKSSRGVCMCAFDRPPLAARRRIPAIGFPVSHLGSANIYLQFIFCSQCVSHAERMMRELRCL